MKNYQTKIKNQYHIIWAQCAITDVPFFIKEGVAQNRQVW